MDRTLRQNVRFKTDQTCLQDTDLLGDPGRDGSKIFKGGTVKHLPI